MCRSLLSTKEKKRKLHVSSLVTRPSHPVGNSLKVELGMNRCLRITVLSSWPISCLVKCPRLFCLHSKSQASIIKPQRQIRIGCCSVRHKLTHVAQPQTSICAGPLLSVREFHTSQPQFAGPLAVLLLKLAGPFSTRIMLTALVGGR